MQFTVFAGIAQFQRDLTSERTKEGIMAARKRGEIPGRPPMDKEKLDIRFKPIFGRLDCYL
jgi:DNA invertase Pin-like site-specific DNA recombinase